MGRVYLVVAGVAFGLCIACSGESDAPAVKDHDKGQPDSLSSPKALAENGPPPQSAETAQPPPEPIRVGLQEAVMESRLKQCGNRARELLGTQGDLPNKLQFSLMLSLKSDAEGGRVERIEPRWVEALPEEVRGCILREFPRSFRSDTSLSVDVEYPMCVVLRRPGRAPDAARL